MTTPLAAWMVEASVQLEAINTTPAFHEVDGRRKAQADRSFSWGEPSRGETLLYNSAATHVEWEVPLVLRIGSAGKSRTAMAADVANTQNLVARMFEVRTQGGAWTTTGLWSVLLDETDTDRLGDGHGDVEVTFTFLVETSETD